MYSDDDNDSDDLNIVSIIKHTVHNNDGREVCNAYHIMMHSKAYIPSILPSTIDIDCRCLSHSMR
jgi:hypothetical protein